MWYSSVSTPVTAYAPSQRCNYGGMSVRRILPYDLFSSLTVCAAPAVTAGDVRVYLVGYIFCIIDCHICRDIFGRIDIMYCILPYVSRCALPLKTLVLYIYRPRGTMQYNQSTNNQQLYPIYSSYTEDHRSCFGGAEKHHSLTTPPQLFLFLSHLPVTHVGAPRSAGLLLPPPTFFLPPASPTCCLFAANSPAHQPLFPPCAQNGAHHARLGISFGRLSHLTDTFCPQGGCHIEHRPGRVDT
jgi:hypothetical protein